MTYRECFESAPILYNVCSTYQRMMDDYGFKLHPDTCCCDWIDNEYYRQELDKVYREYFSVAEQYSVPMILTTTNRLGYKRYTEQFPQTRGRAMTRENVEFVRKIAADFKAPIYIGCIEGCIGDQYVPGEAVKVQEAYDFHREQLEEWVESGADFLYSGIMPEINETIGMAKAFSESGVPYQIGFIITDDGKLLDGTTLHDAINMVDDATENPALMFMCNCIHPTNLLHALEHPFNQTETVRSRLLGTISNASMLKPCELEHCDHIDNADAVSLVDALIRLYDYHPMRLVGGCCGTNETHMREIVGRMQAHLKKN